MGIFANEKQLNDYLEAGIHGLMKQYGMPESEFVKGEDFCRTLMAEYSRLLSEGKIRRPYTYSAPPRDDYSIKLLAEQVFGGEPS